MRCHPFCNSRPGSVRGNNDLCCGGNTTE
jgi:hypothetical protein